MTNTFILVAYSRRSRLRLCILFYSSYLTFASLWHDQTYPSFSSATFDRNPGQFQTKNRRAQFAIRNASRILTIRVRQLIQFGIKSYNEVLHSKLDNQLQIDRNYLRNIIKTLQRLLRKFSNIPNKTNRSSMQLSNYQLTDHVLRGLWHPQT